MAIKIVRDINLDEQSIQVEDDTLSVRISNNPVNKLVKTDSGLEVLDAGSDVEDLISEKKIRDYIKDTYGNDYELTFGSDVFYTKHNYRLGYAMHIAQSIQHTNSLTIPYKNITVEHTLSNYEILTLDEFKDKYIDNPENVLKYKSTDLDLYDNDDTRIFSILVTDLKVKFIFPKNEFLNDTLYKEGFSEDVLVKDGLLRDSFFKYNAIDEFNLKDLSILALIHNLTHAKILYGYNSVNKETTEDDSNFYVTLTYEKYTEMKTINASYESSYVVNKNRVSSYDYIEHASQTMSNTLKSMLNTIQTTIVEKQLKIDPKLNLPVISRILYSTSYQ